MKNIKSNHKFILNTLKNEKNKNILEVGVGSAKLSNLIFKTNNKLIGIDIKDFSKEKTEFPIYYLDICFKKLPFKNNAFDYVILSDVIEHLHNHWFALKEINRVLKYNGKLILNTPHTTSLIQRVYFLFTGSFLRFYKKQTENGHINPMNYYLLKDCLNKLNFKIIKESYDKSFIPLIKISFKGSYYFGDNLNLICIKASNQ